MDISVVAEMCTACNGQEDNAQIWTNQMDPWLSNRSDSVNKQKGYVKHRMQRGRPYEGNAIPLNVSDFEKNQ